MRNVFVLCVVSSLFACGNENNVSVKPIGDCETHEDCDLLCQDGSCTTTSTCNPGYSDDGINCVDDNECAGEGDGNDCHINATCTNTLGSFTCACNTGYTGSGTICDSVAQARAPLLESATRAQGDYLLIFSQPEGSLVPEGGYDTYINGLDQNDTGSFSGFTRTLTGLDTESEQCFLLEGRYTQLTPAQFLTSNEICVAADTSPCDAGYTHNGVTCVDDDECADEGSGNNCDANATCTNTPGSFTCACNTGYTGSGIACVTVGQASAPQLLSATRSSGDYLLTFSQPAGSLDPDGGYDTFINGVDQNDTASHSGFSRTISGLNTHVKQCFILEARYTQLIPAQFLQSNEICVAADDPPTTLKAFPSAYGAAANATGGRGGRVIHVTNLNNSGEGSLREAVQASGARTIVFDVSGTIELTSSLSVSNGNFTLAGQTAPAGGITITGRAVFFQDFSNAIIRYVRFRPVFDGSGSVDAVNFYSVDNVILDHVSASWSGDECISFVGDSDDITVQYSLLGETATGMLMGDSNNPISSRLSVLRNLYFDISHRHPNANSNDQTDVINNVVHNWYSRLVTTSPWDSDLNVIGNYFQRGQVSANLISSGNQTCWLDIRSDGPEVSIYSYNNYINDVMTTPDVVDYNPLWKHRWAVGSPYNVAQFDPAHTHFRSLSQFPLVGEAIPILSPQGAFAEVTANAGACRSLGSSGNVIKAWDAVDDGYLAKVNANTHSSYSYPINPTGRSSYTSFRASVSGTPINSRAAAYDSDNDGMPDVWEATTFGDLSKTAIGDEDGDGYTNLEEFLNLVD